MTVPPDGDNTSPASPPPEPEPPLDFDPYRFGKPDYPIAPEYAPPGYRPDPPAAAPWPPPQQQRNYPPPPPGSAPYGVTRPGNGKATTALVLGILGIVLSSFLTVFALGLAIPAIVLGVQARKDARRFPERGGLGKATAGLVCGIVGVVLVVAITVYVVNKISPCISQDKSFNAMMTCAQDRVNSGN